LTGIRTSKLTPSYTYNTVDNPVSPTQGLAFRASLTIAGLGGNVNMLEPDVEAKYFHHGFRAGHVVALHLRGRLLSGYDGRSAPPFDRFYMGGEDVIRGFDSWSVGPIGLVPGARSIPVLNADGTQRTQTVVVNGYPSAVLVTLPVPGYRLFSVGGDTNVVTNFEYRIPIHGPVTLVLFADAGVNRVTFPNQLRLNVEPLTEEFPEAGFTGHVSIEHGMQNIRTSTGPELEALVPKVNVPVRFYWAWNPLAFWETLYLPIVFDPYTFPNAATLNNAYEAMYYATPYKEPRSKFMFSVGRTF
jgi:outer membrane protein insertion porin family